MEYKKEDWVAGRIYKFIGDENYYGDLINKYPNPGFIVGKAYEMVTDVDEYFVCPYLLPDAKFYIPGDGTYWYEICAFVPVEQS